MSDPIRPEKLLALEPLLLLSKSLIYRNRDHQEAFCGKFIIKKLFDICMFCYSRKELSQVYLASLFFLVCVQYRNNDAQQFFNEIITSSPRIQGVGGRSYMPPFSKAIACNETFTRECHTIKLNHYNEEDVIESLEEIQKKLEPNLQEAQYILMNTRGAVDILIHCMSSESI